MKEVSIRLTILICILLPMLSAAAMPRPSLPEMARGEDFAISDAREDSVVEVYNDFAIGGDSIFARRIERMDSKIGPLLASLPPTYDSTLFAKDQRTKPDPNRNWWHLLWKGKLNMQDTTVEYPRFVKFCVDVYNWGDKAFNSYDTTYVVGTGRRWKTRIMFDAWTDSYFMNLGGKMPVTLISNPYASAAIYLQYMAVSINYGVDLNNLMFNKPTNHRKFEFGFNCARFNLDLAFNKNVGGSYIRTFGDYNRGHLIKEYMPGLRLTSFTADIYYYFNNFRYANGAAYYFSRIQKKSAGSFILGFTFSYEDFAMDFSTLPENLKPYMTVADRNYVFNYYNYCLLFGYGYNWVINKNLLFNISAMPSIGVLHATELSTQGSSKMISLNAKGRMSLTYNKGDFFTCLILKADGKFYSANRLSVFSSIENASLSVGVRF